MAIVVTRGECAGEAFDMVSFLVDVPRLLPTANHRMDTFARARQVAKIRLSVALQAKRYRLQNGIPENTTEPRSVRLTLLRGRRQRLLDIDGAYAACKPVLDALTDAGWLVDDDLRWMPDCVIGQCKDNERGPAVLVEIRVPGAGA